MQTILNVFFLIPALVYRFFEKSHKGYISYCKSDSEKLKPFLIFLKEIVFNIKKINQIL